MLFVVLTILLLLDLYLLVEGKYKKYRLLTVSGVIFVLALIYGLINLLYLPFLILLAIALVTLLSVKGKTILSFSGIFLAISIALMSLGIYDIANHAVMASFIFLLVFLLSFFFETYLYENH